MERSSNKIDRGRRSEKHGEITKGVQEKNDNAVKEGEGVERGGRERARGENENSQVI